MAAWVSGRSAIFMMIHGGFLFLSRELASLYLLPPKLFSSSRRNIDGQEHFSGLLALSNLPGGGTKRTPRIDYLLPHRLFQVF